MRVCVCVCVCVHMCFADLEFIRAEGFVFSHVADEGLMNACAGDLMRYRRSIGADNIMVFADVKKKHRYRMTKLIQTFRDIDNAWDPVTFTNFAETL